MAQAQYSTAFIGSDVKDDTITSDAHLLVFGEVVGCRGFPGESVSVEWSTAYSESWELVSGQDAVKSSQTFCLQAVLAAKFTALNPGDPLNGSKTLRVLSLLKEVKVLENSTEAISVLLSELHVFNQPSSKKEDSSRHVGQLL